MRIFTLVLILFFTIIAISTVINDISVASSYTQVDLNKSSPYELLIGWETGISESERDEIIKDLKGKLKRRFTIIKADDVIFTNDQEFQTALRTLATHRSVKTVETVECNKCDGSVSSSPSKMSNLQESEINTFSQTAKVRIKAGNSDKYTRRFPNSSWRHSHYVNEAQEFADQKQEVIIAVISDQPEDINDDRFYNGSLIRPVQWKNKAEKNGVAGVDDDGNGYIDDIYGINTINIPNEGRSLSFGIINLVAGIANYHPDLLTNPAGKVKLMLITAFYERDYEAECANYWPSVRTTNAALIEALEYATRMGAKLAFVSGHYTHEKSPLVIAAAAAFPGLIITGTDRDTDQECYGDTQMLLQAGLDNVIGVGTGGFYYGGKVDLSASYAWEFGLYPGNFPAQVAGVTAHLMSCYPELNSKQIKNLLLGSTDRVLYKDAQRLIRTGGKLNAARAVLGRSEGGSFYIGDWALIDRKGPGYLRAESGIVYDPQRSRLFLYGGRGLDPSTESWVTHDDFWCWDGKRWSEIPQVKEDGKYPGPVDPVLGPIPFMFDKNRGELILVTPDAVWRWNGTKWYSQPAKFPRDGKSPVYYSAHDFAYDGKRDRVVMYYEFEKLGSRIVEYNGQQWNISDKLIPAPDMGVRVSYPDLRSPLLYNDRIGMVTVVAPTKDKLHTGKLWGYDGKRWRRLAKTTPATGINGQYIYDSKNDRYIRFGSDNLDGTEITKRSIKPSWRGNDVWQLKDGRWVNLGYDGPHFFSREDSSHTVVWANDQQKAIFISMQHFESTRLLFTWQYSGSIIPTWIDNMILPQSDYDGDGKTDMALWHPERGEFLLQTGSIGAVGKWGDIPVPGDYNGDGEVEFAVCRRMRGKQSLDPGSMSWIINNKKIILGQLHDIPVPLDYDGDGKTDIATFRKDTATWYFKGKKKIKFGNPADLPVPADYNGDGRPELATYTPLTSTWHIQGMGDFQFGKPGDSPVPADYDGDGRKDIATWNPRKRLWTVMEWGSNKTLIKERFGSKWDIPVPGDYNGDGKAQLATYTPMKALWNIKGQPSVKFGSPGDVPLVRGN